MGCCKQNSLNGMELSWINLENICLRLGTKSNFAAKDVLVVAMIFAGKKFDLVDPVLKNILEVFKGKAASTCLPYGLLLTQLFE